MHGYCQGFSEPCLLMGYMIDIVSSCAKQLTKPILKNVPGAEIFKVDAASSHTRRNQLVSTLTRHCRG